MAINESQLALLKIQLKRATTSEWNRSTDTGGAWSGYILRQAELGIEVFSDNTTKIKIGNGTSKWSQLPYVAGESGFFVNSLPDASRAIKNNFYIQGDKIYYTSNNTDWVEIGDTSNINFNTLTNRPKYAGSTMRNTTNIPKVPTTASEINYVNGSSGLSTTDVQGAIDEIVGRMANLYTRPIGNNIIFGNNSTGAATTYPLSLSKTASTIVQRTTSGTIKAVDPIENDDVSTKLYVDNKVDPLTTKVNTLETNVASYNTKITNLETRATNLEVDNTTNKNRLTTLEGQVDTNTGNITSLNSRLGTTNINVSQLSTQVGNIQTQLDNLDIDTIETMITDESAIREANDITSMEAGSGTDNNQIKLTKGDGSTITGTIPLVTNSSNGLITYSDYQQIIANRDAIQDLQNQSGGYIGISFATKAALDAYVIPATIRKGQSTFVIDDETHNGATTKYYYDGTSFVYAYIIESDPVGIATTDQAGIVLSKNEAGKIYVESNGVMSLVGYDNLVTTINSKPNFSDLEGITDNNYTDTDKDKVRIITTNGTGNQFLGNDGLYHTITTPETGMINDITVDGNSIVDPITKEVELNKIVLSGSYNDLTNVPSNLVQDSSYVHTDNNFDNTYKSKVNLIVTNGNGKSVLSNDGTYKQLSNVAFSGSYNDLSNIPSNLVQDANYVHTDNNLTDELVELIGQSSGEINTIETISLNGNQILPDAQRNVDIDLSLYALASSVPQNISDLNNDIDIVSDANYVHTDNNLTNDLLNKVNGIAAGAQVNTLETISLNGINIPITNKNVNISLANYATTDNLTTTANTLRGEISDRLRREIVTTLPTGDNIDQNTIYLKLADDPDTNNNYVEWISVNGNWEIVGGSGSTLTAGNGITINNKVISSNNSYLLNGSKIGSLRASNTTSESSLYEMGFYSFAEGQHTKASGISSHAEGSDTTASGQSSHAEGYNTTASGNYSHAEGSATTASNQGSHAEGSNSTASAAYAHAEGYSTASGEASHSEGQSTASGTRSHAESSGTASGIESHAEGRSTAAGTNQHAQGKYNIIDNSNKYAHIVGNGTNSSNRSNAHTIDWNGLGWFAGGLKIGGTGQDDANAKTVATTDQIPTIPSNLPTNILNGSATGSLRGIESTEEGTTYTIGRSAVSLGNTTEASGMYAFAEGFMNKASGMCSHAEGWGSNAIGDYSHSENVSTATGECSHAEGKGTNAIGSQSHAEGNNTKASGINSHVQGKYNIEDTQNKYAHIVGNGTNNSNRSNAHTLDWNGNAWYQGDVYVGGTNQDTGSSKLIPASQLPDFQYRDLDGVLDENNLLDYIKSKYDQSCSGIASVEYYGQPGNDVMYAVYYYQNGYLTYEPIGIYKYHAPSNNDVVWIDGDTRNYENGNITNLVAGTNSVVTVSDVYTTNLSSIVIQYNGGGRFPEYHDVTTTYTMSGTTATCTCNGTNLSNYDSIRAKLTYSDGSTAYTDDYVSGGGAVACFTKDTQVETENGFKSISKIEVGDKVYSYNFETEEIELKEVDKVVKHEIKEITNIYTDNEILETTWSHPFYVVLKGSKLAKDLKVKDQLRMKNNMLTKINMITISELKNKRMVYEIRVKDNHNYFVGNTGVLVFNETSVLDSEE